MSETTSGSGDKDRIETVDQLQKTVHDALRSGASPEVVKSMLDRTEMAPEVREVYESASSIEDLAQPASGWRRILGDTMKVRRARDV